MRKNNQKSLISVHFVCVKAAGSLGCSLAITTTLGREAFQTPFTPGLRFPKYHNFHRKILSLLNFVYNRPSGEFICAFCFL